MNNAIDKAQNPIKEFSGFLDKLKPQLALAMPKHLNADRMARLALTAFSGNRDLQQCTPQSIAGSLMTAGQLGLEPGVNGQGYLIPYKGTCTFVPGWKGLVDLVSRAGRATVWTGAVMPGDNFDYQLGDEPFCRHKPGDEVGGQWTHVYAIGRVRDASMAVIEVWTRAKVANHLANYNKVGVKHYAKQGENNFEKYGRKVALLQVLKYMPQSVEIATATRLADMADTGRGVVLDGDFVRFVDDEPGPGSSPIQPPTFSDDFEAKLLDWAKLVATGKKTSPDLLAMLSTKAVFSEKQKAQILALKKAPEPDTAPAMDADAATFAAEYAAAEEAQ